VKNPTLTFASFTILLTMLAAPVHASVSVESIIGDNIHVTYSLKNLDEAVYNETISNTQLFNSSTIPQTIIKNQEKQNRTHINYLSQPNQYDDATKTIRASFYLEGTDVISYTTNRTTMRKTYQVKTDWRKFQLNLAKNFSKDFTQILAKPVAEWQKINETAYLYENEDISFRFVLPATATNVQARGDTITFEVPPNSWDVFLNSPFLVLAALIIAIIIVLIYRRVR